MAMIKCRECEKGISDEAKTCPHCGCPSEKQKEVQKVADPNTSVGGVLIVVIGIILLALAVVLCSRGGSDLARYMN